LPTTLACIAAVHREFPDVVILGTGGVGSGDAARNLLLAGANVVEVASGLSDRGSELFEDSSTILKWYLYHTGKQVADIIGAGSMGHDFMAFAKAGKPLLAVHDDSICNGCGRCELTCKNSAHDAMKRNSDGTYEVNADRCHGCGLCEDICPTGAVSMKEKPQPTI
jgi:NAD-dependent dihydropyrimidine dehydrogenase PreA subunit